MVEAERALAEETVMPILPDAEELELIEGCGETMAVVIPGEQIEYSGSRLQNMLLTAGHALSALLMAAELASYQLLSWLS